MGWLGDNLWVTWLAIGLLLVAVETITLDFVADLRGVPASEAEAALLRAACDSCGDDPDADARPREVAAR